MNSGNGDSDKLWRQIAGELRTEILSGERHPGTRFFTSKDLAARFNASRDTVQRAANQLKDEDLIEARLGLGWFVCNPCSIRLSRTAAVWAERNARPDVVYGADWHPTIKWTAGPVRASEHVARDLAVEAGTELWVRRRTIFNGKQVLQFGETYLPRHLTRGTVIENGNHRDQGTYAILARLGNRIHRFGETVKVRAATGVEAQKLGLDPRRGTAVLHIVRVAHGKSRLLEVDYVTAPAARLSLHYDLPGPG